MNEPLNDIRLSPHYMLREFLNQGKYPDNIPSMQAVANMTYGSHLLLEPARLEVGPILIDDDAVTDAAAFNITSEYWQIISGDKPVAEMFADMKARAEAFYGPATEKVTEIAAQYGW